jgi:6-phospho-3-hexuloisomerase
MSTAQAILKEVDAVIRQVKEEEIKEIAVALQKAGRIFVVGEGRSGFMAKSFAMRLMHLGAKVYVAGETIMPSIEAGDWLVAVSGSGTTRHVVWTAEKAQSIGSRVIAVTTDDASPPCTNGREDPPCSGGNQAPARQGIENHSTSGIAV